MLTIRVDSETLGAGPRCYRLSATVEITPAGWAVYDVLGEDGRPYSFEELPFDDQCQIAELAEDLCA